MKQSICSPLLLGTSLLLLASSAAIATPVCDRLRSEFSTNSRLDRGALEQDYDRQREAIDELEDRMRSLGCSVGSVTVFGGAHDDACHRMNALLSDMDRNLALIGARLDGKTSGEALAAALRTNGCAGAPPPIGGVSQFNDPSQASIEDLTPGAQPPTIEPERLRTPSVRHIEMPPPSAEIGQPRAGMLPPPVRGPLPQPPARPMNEREKHVRTVGPTFLPDPSKDLDLDQTSPDN